MKIKSGASSDQLTIDGTSKAARYIKYNSSGEELTSIPAGVYQMPIATIFSGTGAGNGIFWAMHIPGSATKSVYVRHLYITAGVHTTGAGGALNIVLSRKNGNAYTGGTALTPIKMDAAYGASVVDDARHAATYGNATVLTEAGGVTITDSIALLLHFENVAINGKKRLSKYRAELNDMLKFAPGEMLVLVAIGCTGSAFGGYIQWEEF